MVGYVARAICRRYGKFPEAIVSAEREMPAFEIIEPIMRQLSELPDLGSQAESALSRPPTKTHVIRWHSHGYELPEDSGVFRMGAGGEWLRWQCVRGDHAPIVLLEQP